uniref:Uncharacterized protein n=1 Tax=Micrurus lemniscatus lemniscatus TaxID=129467 RepID=A0A2D4IM84_MICLE
MTLNQSSGDSISSPALGTHTKKQLGDWATRQATESSSPLGTKASWMPRPIAHSPPSSLPRVVRKIGRGRTSRYVRHLALYLKIIKGGIFFKKKNTSIYLTRLKNWLQGPCIHLCLR